MTALLERLGAVGFLGLALVVAAAAFHVGVQAPLEEQLRSLERSLLQERGRPAAMRASTPPAQLGAFYRFFDQPTAAHEWLAKLYAIGGVAGIELPSADYRMMPTGTRLLRYQLTLPIAATYGQARAFMANALNEIPVLSVDQASFRRARANDPRLEVEIVMTLHLLEP